MGPSGSGKTTLMSVLLGKLPYTGTLRTAGKLSQLKSHIGFVPQDDVMLPTLSVREVLTHSALTRLPTSNSFSEKLAMVDKVLKVLQLENVQHSVIGNIL
jgi:ABC-type multidrug transport system ATPase subunit